MSNETDRPAHSYLSPEALKQATMQSLAQLELQKHQIDMAVAVANGDPETLVGDKTPAHLALAQLDEAIEKIEEKFADILAWQPPA